MSQGDKRSGKAVQGGMVGAGHIAEFHIQALKRIPFVEIVGRASTSIARRRRRWPASSSCQSPTRWRSCAPPAPNVIHVLTPPHTHAAVATEALRAGCHVFVEKPLATDAEDCVRLRDLARAQGLEVGVSHSLLYDPQIRSALEAVRSGRARRRRRASTSCAARCTRPTRAGRCRRSTARPAIRSAISASTAST